MRPSKSSGPLVWLCILLATGLLLYFAKSVLWLVMPMIIAVIQYYILTPVLKQFVLMGLSFKQAATSVMGLLFLVIVVAIFLMIPYVSDYSNSWQN